MIIGGMSIALRPHHRRPSGPCLTGWQGRAFETALRRIITRSTTGPKSGRLAGTSVTNVHEKRSYGAWGWPALNVLEHAAERIGCRDEKARADVWILSP